MTILRGTSAPCGLDSAAAPVAGWAWLSDPVVLVVAFLAHLPVIVGLGMMPAWLGILKLFPDLTRDASRFDRRRHIPTAAMVVFAVGNLVIGTFAANALNLPDGGGGERHHYGGARDGDYLSQQLRGRLAVNCR